jgi:endoglucanase
MRMIARRLLLVAVTLLLLLAGGPGLAQSGSAQPGQVEAEWAKYRDRFVTGDGRVVDTGNKEVSHTEGQGWAMLFAETAGDRASFARIWRWTRDNLQRRDNALFSWRFDPADGNSPIADPNDASDGDILIAWALIRAGNRWGEPEYKEVAQRVLADIRRRLLVMTSGRLVLLPGEAGFKGKDGVTVNPSYYVYPALKEFAKVQPSPQWQRLRRDGLGLLAEARFGRWGLTPDWIAVDKKGGVEPDANFPPRFGFNAIRVPLYLIWGGDATPERLASYLDFWNDYGRKPAPAWTDLKDNSVAPYAGSTGFQAITQLARSIGQAEPPALPTIADNDDYYAASLTLLAMIAQREITR